jgi:predicted ATP-dependent endonuclease of OLD family
MGNLILNSLMVRNFRAFHNLKIEYLSRVNLLVGKNNVGKTSLLEALQMYARRASTPTIISEIMETGSETTLPSKEITCVLVPANGLNREQILELWDGIALTGPDLWCYGRNRPDVWYRPPYTQHVSKRASQQ